MGHKNIHEALNAAMDEIRGVEKSKNNFQNYEYMGEEDIVRGCRDAFIKNGIVVYPAEVISTSEREYTTPKNKMMYGVTIIVRYHFHHAPSDTGIDTIGVGENSDSGDKATAGAMTNAYKYAIRQTLMLHGGVDPDAEEAHERAASASNGSGASSNGSNGSNGSKPKAKALTASQKGEITKFCNAKGLAEKEDQKAAVAWARKHGANMVNDFKKYIGRWIAMNSVEGLLRNKFDDAMDYALVNKDSESEKFEGLTEAEKFKKLVEEYAEDLQKAESPF